MKKFLTSAFFLQFIVFNAAAQGMWTWMSGDSTSYVFGVFVTKGIPSSQTLPSAGEGGAYWTDRSGKFWYLDGNYLVKYDPSTLLWTWVSGNEFDNATYGTQGVPDSTNTPAGRLDFFPNWVDTSGNLWLLGGLALIEGYQGYAGDLWKYDISTNEWTWVNGADTFNPPARYGVKGVPSPNNSPGTRNQTSAAWVDDSTNTLWMYGGNVADSANFFRNDLWKYDIATNEWTWMGGDSTGSYSVSPVYGTKGVPAANNSPGHRGMFATWTDKQDNFWSYGGGIVSKGIYNDFWMYNPGSNIWTWMAGPDTAGGVVSLGANCQYSPTNIPAAAYEDIYTWKDNRGNFWHSPDDRIWQFDPNLLQWEAPSGTDSTAPAFSAGQLGVPSPTTWPGFTSGKSWTDLDGNFWLLNLDPATIEGSMMFRYVPDTTCGTGVTTGVNNLDAAKIYIYPNPVSDILNIVTGNFLPESITIYDLQGRKISEEKFQQQINVGALTNGLYFIQLKTPDSEMTGRFVKE